MRGPRKNTLRSEFIRFTLFEEACAMPFLSWAYSLNPANRGSFLVALLYVLACGCAIAAANAAVYAFNKRVVWSSLRALEKALRIAYSAAMTDAVFYSIYSCIHSLTGLWPISSETPASIAAIGAFSIGISALFPVATLSPQEKPDDDTKPPNT